MKPVASVRPALSKEDVLGILSERYCLQGVLEVKELPSYEDRNYYVKTEKEQPNEFVLKIMNSSDSTRIHVDGEIEFQKVLNLKGFCCPEHMQDVNGNYKSYIQLGDSRHMVRLLTYLPGTVLGGIIRSPDVLVAIGKYVADVHNATKDFRHPCLRDNPEYIWSLENVPKLHMYLDYISDDGGKDLVREAIKLFEKNVIPNMNLFEHGTIHGDINEGNLIVLANSVTKQGIQINRETMGLIDFNESNISCLIFDLTCAVTYMMIENKGVLEDFVDAGGYVIGGYLKNRPISELEISLLPYCVLGRYAQTLSISTYTQTLDPKNQHIFTTSHSGWEQLEILIKKGADEILRRWREIASSTT
ncbi:hypothetical protein HELRODRAFT_185292 [Helobdella robusta]|uniref:Hydroxylysine kinase n=1 Tax=Helobdella robusta TaxID=6412 RepID=T1FMM3_HELRO|nr:hypothetical protein HELRODRAFT_185292 [Helobdella robusta]ESO10891.1 hypothetical protein HELRODRAFT_185292 [Helobdella robusta]